MAYSARMGKLIGPYLVAQIAIQFGADALHRGESGHEDRIKIGGGI